MKKVVIFDFDGTATLAEEEGRPFVSGFLEDISSLTGKPLTEIFQLAEKIENEVMNDPANYGWEYQGNIVAPAVVDPYLRTRPIATKILQQFGFSNHGVILRLLDLLFKYNYPKTKIVFKPNAGYVFNALKDLHVYIVTNVSIDPLKNKIKALIDQSHFDLRWLNRALIGSAKKYVIDNGFDLVPQDLSIPGLETRKILLRRKHYFEALDKLRQKHSAQWPEFYVIGDIFELDLSLPYILGAKIGLVVNKYTPQYEIDFVRNCGQGAIITELMQIPDFVHDKTR